MNRAIHLTDISNRKNLDNVTFKHYTDLFSASFNLTVYQSGHKSYSTPGFMSRLSIYDHYIIHYVTSGRGTYFIDGQSLPVETGQCFLIPPYKTVQYQADQDDPWTYYWVGFNGPKALELLQASDFDNQLIITPDAPQLEPIFSDLVGLTLNKNAMKYALLGYLHLIFAQFIGPNEKASSEHNHYYRQALIYIKENYADPDLSVEAVAHHVGLTRSYLYKIFQKTANSSISDTIQNLRLSKAVYLLEEGGHSISDIATMVGFNSQAYFSKMFKSQFKLSPTDYRKKLVQKNIN